MSTQKTTRKYKSYAEKLEHQKNGTYEGDSPFYKNIPEFQHLKPLYSYPHLAGLRADERRVETTRPEYN